MTIRDLIPDVLGAADVHRVFGEPVERDGVTVVPVAAFRGGGGGGSGEGPAGDDQPQGSGSGGGYGLTARPVGVYVIKDGEVRFQPSVDVARAILGGQIVAVIALLVFRSVARRRRWFH